MNFTENASEFVDWLTKELKYTPKAARDVVSRCKRAESILSANDFTDTDLYLFKLNQENAFKVLSVSVRSQIRRAIRLHTAYKEKNNLNQQIPTTKARQHLSYLAFVAFPSSNRI